MGVRRDFPWPLGLLGHGPPASLGGFIALAVGASLWVAVQAVLAGRHEWVLAIGVEVADLVAVRGQVLIAITDPTVRESLPVPAVDPRGA